MAFTMTLLKEKFEKESFRDYSFKKVYLRKVANHRTENKDII